MTGIISSYPISSLDRKKKKHGGVEPKIGGFKTPKMDGENNGNPY